MRFFWLCLLALILPARCWADAGASDWIKTESGQVRLIAAEETTGHRDSLTLGLHFQLQPGWKIYWRTPGDAGYPPKLDWSGSENLGTVDIAWPAPKRFVLAGLQNYGYSGEVILPLTAHLRRPDQAVNARLTVEFLACEKICVPMQASLRLDLPAEAPRPSAFVHDLGRFLALVPGDGARHGLTLQSLTVSGQGDGSHLYLTVSADQPFDHPDLFIEPAELGSFEAPVVHLSRQNQQAILELIPAPGTVQGSLAGLSLQVTMVDGSRSLTTQHQVIAAPPPVFETTASSPPGGSSLLPMLALALLGGLILNVMPCVLPVLSIKLLGVLQHGQGDIRRIRRSFLASALGIVFSFLILGGTAIGLKLAGSAVGWGIQFQQPAFLAVMVGILLIFAANLAGFFEIRLPSAILSLGSGAAAAPTLLGNFLTGALATLLATPCSAPFLGTAVGFALARGPLEISLIFLSLGLGMAAPYWLVCLRPDLARRLPKPGPWMVRIRQIMAVALLGTALWLGSILWTQERGSQTAKAQVLPWQTFSQAALQQAVEQGKLVFVDVTADWCITCKVNKTTVLYQDPVKSRLLRGDVVLLEADWTRPDAAIAAYLAGFGRYGIPFNAVYGPAAVNGLPLPELPSAQDILDALNKAAQH